MPHSSGGGSHGGGSFSGGHSFSGGSGTRSQPSYPLISNTYHAGYHRYVVYHASRPSYFYSRSPITEKDTRPHIAGPAMMVLFAVAFLAIFLASSYHRPEKLATNDTAIRVVDRGNVLAGGDEALLNDVLTASGRKPASRPLSSLYPQANGRAAIQAFPTSPTRLTSICLRTKTTGCSAIPAILPRTLTTGSGKGCRAITRTAS